MKTTSFFVPILAAACVSAHGFLSKVTINGKVFNGNIPSGASNPSPIRQVTSQDPNKLPSTSVVCGPGAKVASQVANANPGDTVLFDWKTASLGNWPHNIGPMLTYMANCNGDCTNFDATQAKWFKIQQVGKQAGSSTWVQNDLFNGKPATITLPKNLAAGNYILRHEIIALHLATSVGGAEFYPGCTQIQVGGSQTGAPKSSELVSLPGAYSANDPGIFDPNVFNSDDNYVFPGPAIASFVSGAATPSNNSSGSGSATTTSAPKATSTKKSSSTCKIKKRAASANADVVVRPRHASRIMRRLAFEDSLH